MGRCNQRKNGFTLIELMITMAVVSVIMVAVISAFDIQQKSQVKQQLIAEAQQNGRAAMYMLARDIRMTSFGLGDGEVGIAGETNSYKAIEILDGGANGYDQIQIVYAATGDLVDATGAGGDVNAFTTTQVTDMGDELKVDNIGGFSAGDVVIITNGSYSSVLNVTNVDEPNSKIEYEYDATIAPPPKVNPSKGLGAGFEIGSRVYKMRYMTYRVNDTDPSNPVMEVDRDGPIGALPFETIAEDIEDLQVAYVFEDGYTWADGNQYLNYDDTDADSTNDYEDIRAVRVSVLARTRSQRDSFSGERRPAIENHQQGASDSYGRRLLTLELKIRNFGL